MKQHPRQPPEQLQRWQTTLCQALAQLDTPELCQQFMQDLCTPAELEAMADRWVVVGLLEQGLPYREIHEKTGVSVTTVGRVARCLSAGGGYRQALDKIDE